MALPTSITHRYVHALEAELQAWLSQRTPVGHHYQMLAYHMGWCSESLEPVSGPRGKRFRPLLCLLACDGVGGRWEDALPMAAAIEFLHNFSLIHDDIEDHDESRHHRPSLWKLWGEPLAINAGDAMLALSGLAALSSSGDGEISRRFQETALALTEGQYLDMSFERRMDVSSAEYFEMIGLKSGAIIAFSCEAGGRLGGGSETQVEALTEFGRHFGLAFQICDDVRGIWAGLEQTGKAPAKDILNRKKSLPVLLALERARGMDLDRLHGFYDLRRDEDPAVISDVIESTGVREEMAAELRSHLHRAYEALAPARLVQPYEAELRALAGSLVDVASA